MTTREQIIGDAVRMWGTSEDDDDEADIALEKVLVEQGVLQAGDEAYFESDHVGLVHVFLDEVILQIDTDGNIERF